MLAEQLSPEQKVIERPTMRLLPDHVSLTEGPLLNRRPQLGCKGRKKRSPEAKKSKQRAFMNSHRTFPSRSADFRMSSDNVRGDAIFQGDLHSNHSFQGTSCPKLKKLGR